MKNPEDASLVLRNIKDEKEISEATEERLKKAIEAFKEKFV